MSNAENSKGNGSASGPQWQAQGPQSLGDHGRQIHHEAEALVAAVRGATDDVRRSLT